MCLNSSPAADNHKYQNRQMPHLPSISNVYTEENEDGVHIRIEGEGDFLPGRLLVMVRPATDEETTGESTGTEDSGTSEGGRPEVMPIDMGFGHFMMNMQTGAICWCPSGTLQPDDSPDWVVVSDPLTSADPGHEQEGGGSGRNDNNEGGMTVAEEGASSRPSQNSTNSQNVTPMVAAEEDGEANEIGFAAEWLMEGNMHLHAETDSACSQ